MSKGFKSTLFAGVITLSAFAPAFAAAPVISGLPDVQVGDLEASSATDNNFFVFSDAFNFSDYVMDADSPDSQLTWTFAEYNTTGEGLGPNQYTINGQGPTSNGEAEIAAEELAGNPKAKLPANAINTVDSASFRDIILSPEAGTAPFAAPSAAQNIAAAAGKVVRYYVADPEGNVSFTEAIITSVDNEDDMLFADTDGYTEIVRDTDFGTSWSTSGIPAADVSGQKLPGKLTVTVNAAQGRTRIFGWKNESMMSYDEVGPSKMVHGKFYIHTTNGIFTPINEVPGFRLRITNETIDAAVHFEYGQTGVTGTPAEPGYATSNFPQKEETSFFVRPTDQIGIPSLYKVDFDPIDVPAAAGTRIGALMESFATPDPANGTLTLEEVVLGTYDAKDDSDGNLVFEYNRATGLNAGAAGNKNLVPGAFNAENNLEPGRRQALQIPGRDVAPYASIVNQGTAGIFGTTDPVPQDKFGIGLITFESFSPVDRLRIEPSKLYRAKFYATSSVPSARNTAVEIQSGLRFRFQTVAGTVNYLLEIVGAAQANAGSPEAEALAIQAIPSSDSQNPETDPTLDTAGEKGGWYSVMVSSPLDPNGIRQDYEEFDTFGGGGFFTLGVNPGPGQPGPSAKDVALGLDLIQVPTQATIFGNTLTPFAQQNRSEARLSAIEVYEYPAIDDGGYDY